ncbi:MAG: hypothetical protein CLLPBCKN_001349 [Chroococcidiopsis cubana SAG 39.79]|nr:hypothetical protein [Chroococcidiopsis cubana SAG 39.79]
MISMTFETRNFEEICSEYENTYCLSDNTRYIYISICLY